MRAQHLGVLAVAGAPHGHSRSRWVISRPRFRASSRSRSNSIGVRWISSPSRRTSRRARSTSSPSAVITASSGSGAIRRRFACSRAISSRGPERLGHVVVGAGRQRADLGVLVADGREHDHRASRSTPAAAGTARCRRRRGARRSMIAASGRLHGRDVERLLDGRSPAAPRTRRRAGSPAARAGSAARRRRRAPRSCRGVQSARESRSGRSRSAATTTKLVPWPGSDSTEIVPPLASTKPFAIARPRPDPVQFRPSAAPR